MVMLFSRLRNPQFRMGAPLPSLKTAPRMLFARDAVIDDDSQVESAKRTSADSALQMELAGNPKKAERKRKSGMVRGEFTAVMND